MFYLLVFKSSIPYPYVIYDLNNPSIGNALPDLQSMFYRKPVKGISPWPKWISEECGTPLQTYTFKSKTQFRLDHPELFI